MTGLRSIATRLALWSLCGSMIVLCASGLVLLSHLRAQWLSSTQREGNTLALAAARGIEVHLQRVAETTRLLAHLAATGPERARQLARETLKSNTDVSGVAFAWIPTDPRSPPQAPFVDRLADGRVTQRDLRHDPSPYWEQRWFVNGADCVEGCWQQPFFSKSRQQRLINYSMSIRQDEASIGVVNTDVRLAWLKEVLGTLRRPEGALMFVLDPQGRYLAHDDERLLGKPALPELRALLHGATREGPPIAGSHHPDIASPSWVFSAPIGKTGWTFGLLIPRTQLEGNLRRLFAREMILGLIAMLCIAAITLLVARRTLAPLAILTQRAEHVARGELDFALPRARRKDEIGRMTRAFDAMRQQLAVHLDRLTQATREQERLRSELDIAHQIQVALLPNAHYLEAQCAMFELHAVLRPARAVGGDLYTYFMLDEQHFCVMVGDVSDKGIPAALFMARAITLAKALAPRAGQPSQLLERLNRELCRSNDGCMFVTLLCGVLDIVSGRIVLASAGHEPPILCNGGTLSLIHVETGPAIGLEEDATYPEHALQLAAGDTLVMYTDGITEANDATGAMFGIERALASLECLPAPCGATDFTHHLLHEVDSFASDCDQADDITILALMWNHGGTQKKEVQALDLTLRPNLPDVLAALDHCDLLLAEAGIADGTREDVRLVLEELMVNLVNHGHAGHADGNIQLRVRPSGGAVNVELHDNGLPFDPRQAPVPALSGDLADPDEVGGLGLHLVRTMTRDLRYNHDSEGNHLQFRFPSPDDTETAS